jgi:hypothetical protein
MGRVRRVQPSIGAEPQGVPQQNTIAPATIPERQKGLPGRSQPPRQVTLPQAETAQPPPVERQTGFPQRQAPQQQAAPPQAEPQSPAIERQKGFPQRQQPQQQAAPPATSQPEAGRGAPPQAEPQQSKGNGKQQKSAKQDDSKKKSDQ